MEFGGKAVLGLDIGSHSIKAVEIRRTREGPVIAFAQSIPVVPRESEEEKELATRNALEALVKEARLRRKRVVAAVPSSLEEQVTMRTIFIPDAPINAPHEVIQMSVQAEFEAQDYITYNDNAQIDFYVEGELTLNGVRGLEVFVVAVHRELVERRAALLKACGLVPVAIDVDFLALARLIVTTRQLSKNGDTAVLDIGATKTAVGFYQRRKLYLYPHIPIGGNQLTAQLAQLLNIDWESAELCKHKQTDEPKVWETLENCLDRELYQQLYVNFDAYEREFPESKPGKIVVSGVTAQLPRLERLFDARFSIPVEMLHYLDKIPVQSVEDTAALRGNEPLFATAVGLALKPA